MSAEQEMRRRWFVVAPLEPAMWHILLLSVRTPAWQQVFCLRSVEEKFWKYDDRNEERIFQTKNYTRRSRWFEYEIETVVWISSLV